jgi:hypothetical protein
MFFSKHYQEAANVWLARAEEAKEDEASLSKLIEDIEDTIWVLWTGQLRDDAMEFYRYLNKLKGELKIVYNATYQTN